MRTHKIGPLYAKSSQGKIKEWQVVVVEDKGKVLLNTLSGYVNGRKTSATREIAGKNIGKSNETSPFEQGKLEAESKANEKRDKGYFDTIEETDEVTLALPMLAHPYTKRKHNIVWPAYVQPKLNGVRCIARMTENDPEYVSRKGKLFTTLSHLNEEVERLTCELEKPLDGEIFHPEWNFQEIIRAVKKDRGEVTDKLEYWVYDIVATNLTFDERIGKLSDYFVTSNGYFNPNQLIRKSNIVLVPTYEVTSEEEMMAKHKQFTKAGYEGTIIRNAKGKYVLNHRSADLQKFKDFQDDEFEIIDGEEATGEDKGTVVFICRTVQGKTFKVRPRGSRDIRREWFDNIQHLIGQQLTVRYQELSEDNIPIFPVGLAIRDYE